MTTTHGSFDLLHVKCLHRSKQQAKVDIQWLPQKFAMPAQAIAALASARRTREVQLGLIFSAAAKRAGGVPQ